MEGLTKEDKLMLRQADKLIETKFLNKTIKKGRNKRFGLAGWIMGWGLGYFSSLRTIKDNIRTLQPQNKLQQDQILELFEHNICTCIYQQICYKQPAGSTSSTQQDFNSCYARC